MRTYTAKNGKKRFAPSLAECEQMSNESEGFCLACGNRQSGVEPDARGYVCEACGEAKVFGAEELVLMGLVH